MNRDSFSKIDAPAFELLIDIAIEEENPDEVARWYKKLKIREKREKTGILPEERKLPAPYRRNIRKLR
ncbi:hypothetical protein [Methanosarcina sp. 1.H.A.2.2]|uniref:hypothetical protein n=1 Tax=Methanosarcina sp. 1.H.A.2.2 TaxID=1483601 RepID=UPI000621C529|nr:hypothetical protein [Methanosarcina sp. 1.H.A.2.2]KKH46530.1 hypothetical protein EO93_04100 [Methanosarcina sp. 1.H.A.2.2]